MIIFELILFNLKSGMGISTKPRHKSSDNTEILDNTIAELSEIKVELSNTKTVLSDTQTLLTEAESKINPIRQTRYIYQTLMDGRYINGSEMQEYCDYLLSHCNEYKQVFGYYYYKISLGLPSSFWTLNSGYKYCRYTDWTGATAFPDMPADTDNFGILYFDLRRSAGNSIGNSGISAVPTTWRNAKGIYRIVMERQEMSSEQQELIALGIEREILAGLGSKYTSNSSTIRYIDYNSASSGANDPLDQTNLVIAGWTATSDKILTKSIVNPVNGVSYTWRIIHR